MIKDKKYSTLTNAIIFGLVFSFAAFSSSVIATESTHEKWGYQGEIGPANWSKLSKNYYACNNGKNQSPVNIDNTIDGKLPSIPYNYSILVGESIKNNGHTVQVNIRSGGEIEVDDKKFTLKQFHFHVPSENTINKRSFPAEVHFVHVSEEGQLAVIAMMYTLGAPDPLLWNLARKIPFEKDQSFALGSKDLSVLETDKALKAYIRFNGSLTTPPCSEGVIWLVKKPYLNISMQQLNLLQKALKQPNNRPVQAINSRIIID
ncbi:MAG: carbonic anhydrase family protein [Pseudomonadota bacterium]